eukprot:COSAG04_NODE_16705_length_491_cov_1.505102_1_plen_122_part_10
MEHVMTFKVGSEAFTYTWHSLLSRGWVEMMPWRLDDLKLNLLDSSTDDGGAATLAALSAARVGDVAMIAACSLTEGVTEPPPYLREHELIEAMDKQGIGTDASIPTHVQNIVDRRYLTVCDS